MSRGVGGGSGADLPHRPVEHTHTLTHTKTHSHVVGPEQNQTEGGVRRRLYDQRTCEDSDCLDDLSVPLGAKCTSPPLSKTGSRAI